MLNGQKFETYSKALLRLCINSNINMKNERKASLHILK